MRQIKFRGETFGGKSIYGDLGHHGRDLVITNSRSTCYVKPESVAQLVGWDGHGEEIYEGDVLLDDYEQEHVAEIYDRPNFLRRRVLKRRRNNNASD